jgi:hypothetical protein
VTALLASGLALDAGVLATIALAVGYLLRVVMPRPPVGRFVWSDILVMIVVLVVMPFAYIHMPIGLVMAVFGLTMFVVVQVTLAPMLGGNIAALTAVALCAADVGAALAGWKIVLLVVNDFVVIAVTVGVTNMWAQTGMTPGHVAGLAAALAVYDTLATGLSSMTLDFVGRVAGMPFAPMLAVQYGSSPALIGLGDCLMLTIWPLVAARTYGWAAARWAVAVNMAVLGAIFFGLVTHVLRGGVPVLTPLGPLIVIQCLLWRRRPPTLERRAAVETAVHRHLIHDFK